jgi:hypothetical protein
MILFYYSIIPGWNKQNGCPGIPSYQQFVEFPIHLIIFGGFSAGVSKDRAAGKAT